MKEAHDKQQPMKIRSSSFSLMNKETMDNNSKDKDKEAKVRLGGRPRDSHTKPYKKTTSLIARESIKR